MKKYNLFEFLAVITMLALTIFAGISCSRAQADTQKLEGVTWVLKSYGDPASLKQVIGDKEITLTFNRDKKEATGNGGVNGFGRDYEVNGNQLKITDIVHTLIASTNQALNEQETAYFKLLNSAKSFEIKDKQLTITGDEGTLVFFQK